MKEELLSTIHRILEPLTPRNCHLEHYQIPTTECNAIILTTPQTLETFNIVTNKDCIQTYTRENKSDHLPETINTIHISDPDLIYKLKTLFQNYLICHLQPPPKQLWNTSSINYHPPTW